MSPDGAGAPLPRAAAGGDPGPLHRKLRAETAALEGVFLGQLFAAMRATVPADGAGHGPGDAMFQALLDEQLAAQAAQRLEHGLGAALYRQLSRHLPEGA
ncbi:MAG: rod-binding protein [Gemmatimonadales bacterium]|nr:rod-binding protein [Gemmatimonadales bacterium]